MDVLFVTDNMVQDVKKVLSDMETDFNSYITRENYNVSWAKNIEQRRETLTKFFYAALQTIHKLFNDSNTVIINNNYDKDVYSTDITDLKLKVRNLQKQVDHYELILKFHNWNEIDLKFVTDNDWKEFKRQQRIDDVKRSNPELY